MFWSASGKDCFEIPGSDSKQTITQRLPNVNAGTCFQLRSSRRIKI
jgi:hypothetical protein